jgi:hypothetical protein
MTRRALSSLALSLAVFTVAAAHADPPHRGWGGGRADHGSAGQPYQRPHGYAAGPPAYSAPPARGRYYAPPSAPYEPPIAPYDYPARPNSLGAEWGQQQDEARTGVREGRIMPLSRVVQALERLRPGRVLDAGLETGPDGRSAYRVRWAAAGGRRIDFIVDAETGAIIGRGAE